MAKKYQTDNKSFMIYKDWEEIVLALDSDEEAGKLFKALFAFAKRGDEPEFTGALKMAYIFIRNTIERDGEKWEETCKTRSKAGKISGQVRQAKLSSQKQKGTCVDFVEHTETNQTDKDTDTEKDTEIVTDTEKERETAKKAHALPHGFNPPPSPQQNNNSYLNFGQYNHVLLTKEQYKKLIIDFGADKTNDYINRCDHYVQTSGKSYRDFDATIRKWIAEDIHKTSDCNTSHKSTSYDMQEIDDFQKYFLLNRMKEREGLMSNNVVAKG